MASWKKVSTKHRKKIHVAKGKTRKWVYISSVPRKMTTNEMIDLSNILTIFYREESLDVENCPEPIKKYVLKQTNYNDKVTLEKQINNINKEIVIRNEKEYRPDERVRRIYKSLTD